MSRPTCFRAPSCTVPGLAVRHGWNSNLPVNAGLFNVTDEKHFLVTDVIGLAASKALRDLYARPGRYAAVNVIVRW